MIRLDYRNDNPRWGQAGIIFSSWEQYALTLGYISNVVHYRNSPVFRSVIGKWDKKIEIQAESTSKQEIWGKAGGILYYGAKSDIKKEFPDLYKCKSKGEDGTTFRFNSDDYMYSLVNDYHFSLTPKEGGAADIFPPFSEAYDSVWEILERHLQKLAMPDEQIRAVKRCFRTGWEK